MLAFELASAPKLSSCVCATSGLLDIAESAALMQAETSFLLTETVLSLSSLQIG